MLTQQRWRLVGALAIGTCAVMVWHGTTTVPGMVSMPGFVVYWGFFLAMFVTALVCAFLDLRYIRLEYGLRKRDLLRATLKNEGFRQALREAQRKREYDSRN